MPVPASTKTEPLKINIKAQVNAQVRGKIKAEGKSDSAAQGKGSSARAASVQWSMAEDNSLREIVMTNGIASRQQSARETAQKSKPGSGNSSYGMNWKRVAVLLGTGRTDVQCLHRWKKVLRPGLVKGPWTKEEDDELTLQWNSGNRKWSNIATKLPGRMGKQCRERWMNHLDPSINKSAWTEHETRTLMDAQKTLGNRWTVLAKLLPGRSENSVKNAFHSKNRMNMKHLITKKMTATGLEPAIMPNSNLQHSNDPALYRLPQDQTQTAPFFAPTTTTGLPLDQKQNPSKHPAPFSAPTMTVSPKNSAKRRRSSWSDDEDEHIIKCIKNDTAKGATTSWAEIAEGLSQRSGKQCKERWNTELSPDVNHDGWVSGTSSEMAAVMSNPPPPPSKSVGASVKMTVAAANPFSGQARTKGGATDLQLTSSGSATGVKKTPSFGCMSQKPGGQAAVAPSTLATMGGMNYVANPMFSGAMANAVMFQATYMAAAHMAAAQMVLAGKTATSTKPGFTQMPQMLGHPSFGSSYMLACPPAAAGNDKGRLDSSQRQNVTAVATNRPQQQTTQRKPSHVISSPTRIPSYRESAAATETQNAVVGVSPLPGSPSSAPSVGCDVNYVEI
jgi:hypothetical protein